MKKYMTAITRTLCLSILMMVSCASTKTFEWDASTQLATTPSTPIPAEQLNDVRYVVWGQRVGESNWTAYGTTASATNALTVELPAGRWNIAVTAHFEGETAHSVMSDSLEDISIYGIIMKVLNVRIVD